MLLSYGSKGEEVKRLQILLGIKVDGVFGKDTKEAVILWQKKNGLKADGIVGNQTATAMGLLTPTPRVVNIKGRLNVQNLKGYIPDVTLKTLSGSFSTKNNITTNLRLAHFISQCAYESGDFKNIRENLNYSKDGLMKVFPKYFPNSQSTRGYVNNPQKIANKVYANRMGNGDEKSGDGWNYRGRGYIQLTGRSNYKSFSDFIGQDCVTHPDLVATKYPLSSAAYFFTKNKLWDICDKGSHGTIISEITKKINGGLNGIDGRLLKFKTFYDLLNKKISTSKSSSVPQKNLPSFSYSLADIQKVLKEKKYKLFTKDYELNIIAIRDNSKRNLVTNLFDDWLTVSYKVKGKWYMQHWCITTDPGKRAMLEVKNPKGVAILVPDQYLDSYIIGLHKGRYTALRQNKAVRVYRDRNKDLQFNTSTIDTGIFGINIHRSSPTGTSTYVENWSEGCQVFANISDFNAFMSICKKSMEIHGNKFTYTLLESNDFKTKRLWGIF